MGLLWQDVRHGFRMLTKSPAFSLVAIVTLALGIGANTAIFSVINALFLHPPGVAEPEQVVVERARYLKIGLKNIVVSLPDYVQMRDSTKIFAAAAAATGNDFNYTGGAYPENLQGVLVTGRWFDVFGAKPILGRVFTAAEDQPNANHEVILSYGTWERWFGSDPNAVGRTIQLNQQPYQIIGVMGRDFHWPDPKTDLWAPLGSPLSDFAVGNTFNESYLAVGRLRAGVTFAEANAYLRLVTQRVLDNPATAFAKKAQWSLFLMPFADYVFGDLRMPILILGVAVAFVLLIACANIAGLLLAKGAGRSKELAVRAALGASRLRLIGQALAETAVLGLAGVLLGLLFALEGIHALLFAAPRNLLTGASFPLDGHVLLFTALVGLVAVLISGSIPAWQLSQADPYNALRESGRSSTGSRARQNFRSFLVAGELALGLILLTGTGLLLKSLARISEVNPGFDPHGVMTAAVSLPKKTYDTAAKQSAFFRSVLQRLSHTPGIKDAGAGYPLPFTGGNDSASFEIEGQPAAAGNPGPHGDIRYVTPGYFTALGIPLLQGRILTDDDRSGSEQVAVIDENLAHQYWPNQNPIGQRIRRGSHAAWATIVGVVGHIRFNQLAGEETSGSEAQSGSKGVYYFPIYQTKAPYGFLMAKSSLNPASAQAAIRDAVRSVDGNMPVSDMHSMDTRIAQSLGPQKFAASLLALFAGLAILLAAVGLYGLISYSVAQRSNEIGIRMALGAQPSHVMAMILRQGARLALLGVFAGMAIGLLLTRAIESLLYGVSAFDPVSFLGAALFLVLVALLACYIPARRAMKVDPLVALRYE